MCLSALAARRSRCQRGYVEFEHSGLKTLNSAECIGFLATTRVGRVALSQNALPTIIPVFYEVNETSINFQISEGVLGAAAERGDIVCFEADFTDFPDCLMWTVVVVGKLQLSSLDFGADGGNGDAVSKAGAVMALLPMTVVSGRAASALLESE